ncbi:hypothetical protein YQE_11775, partial [Dendroctonus ponderosae]
MNDNFQYESDAKLIDSRDCLTYDNQTGAYTNSPFEFDDFTDERVYGNYAENAEVSSSDASCQPIESEVKSLKDWLILHNDLIQQQNEEILEKEHRIYVLQRENEMLKERLLCIEKGVPYQPEQQPIVVDLENAIPSSPAEDMTQDSCTKYDQESKEDGVSSLLGEDVLSRSLEATNHQSNPVLDEAESQTSINTNEKTLANESELKIEDCIGTDLSDSFRTESDPTECGKDSLSEYNFTNEHQAETDQQLVSFIPRRPTNVGREQNVWEKIVKYCPPMNPTAFAKQMRMSPTLNRRQTVRAEVPRWRVKVFTSCYTMEGTENLDDEVYNKRHLRLEIDERRRKRWDVQRIREQRVIDKLKQRQERIANNGSKGENDQDLLYTLWPKMDDVKYVEMVDELPVSAFGHPIPQQLLFTVAEQSGCTNETIQLEAMYSPWTETVTEPKVEVVLFEELDSILSETFSVHNRWPGLVVLLSADPHLLERAETGQNAASNPNRCNNLAVGQFVGLFETTGHARNGQILLKVQRHKANLLLKSTCVVGGL